MSERGNKIQEKYRNKNEKKKIKVMTIFGTRPEAIKMAPVIKELQKRKQIKCIVCVTAQHREMLDQVLEVFKIYPDYDLNIMKTNQSLSEITAKVLKKIEKIIKKEKPNIVLVHGDTTTAFASALAAFYVHTDIGHVESGLRTWNKYEPYPEEINRQMIDGLTDICFAPTNTSKENLLKEGREKKSIYVTGNTVIDALKTTLKEKFNHDILKWIGNDRLVLLTTHRRENIGEPMRNTFQAIRHLVEDIKDIKVVYPAHLNNKVRDIANEVLNNCDRIKIIEPLNVIDFHNIMNKAYIILTDSGGIQEEATFLGKPVLVLRNTTERLEEMKVGNIKVIGTEQEKIYEETKRLLNNQNEYNNMKKSELYKDINASKNIVDIIIKKYCSS